MDKFGMIGEAVLSSVIALVFALECARFFFDGKPAFLIFLPLAWIFVSVAWSDINALRK